MLCFVFVVVVVVVVRRIFKIRFKIRFKLTQIEKNRPTHQLHVTNVRIPLVGGGGDAVVWDDMDG